MLSTVGHESTVMEVWRSIVDLRTTAMIGIYGRGGVGKTTLLKKIYSKLTSSSPLHFDIVIWVTVSQNLSVERVQDDIWKSIGVFNVEWVDKTFEEKAKSIFEVLSKKKLVLLLDDLGEKLNLTQLGVPVPEENKCKVIFTTRSQNVCLRMGAHVTIPVVALEWKYAWELFKNKVGEDRLTDPRILELAQTMARTCKGLPVLLCTVARAMASMTTYHEWLGAIKGLEFQVDKEGGKEYEFTLLKLCFDCLDRKVRSCLLYFCLFPEDFTILKNELIDYWICDQLLGHYSLEVDVLNFGYKTLDTLIGACLLEEEQLNYVKLLDLIREFIARLIRVRTDKVPIGIGDISTSQIGLLHTNDRILKVASRKEVGRILGMRNLIRNLRDCAPNNLFIIFLLSHNPFIMIKAKRRPQNEDLQQSTSTEALENLFLINNVIKNLRQFKGSIIVLDLSNSGVEKLPREIAELVSLEYLNLSGTWIDHLPIDIKNLVKLKCLNLEYNDQLRVIPKQLILKLSSLQVLKMFRCGYSVEEIEDNILSLMHMDIDPIFCLEHLKVLSITITCALALDKLFKNHKILRCIQSMSLEVFWGCKSLDISSLAVMENLLVLEIRQFEHLNELNCHPLHLEFTRGRSSFGRLREITLDKCSSLVEVTWVILVPNLAILKLQNCEEMEEVISNRRMGETCGGENWEPFGKLEILTLENLPELKSIYWKILPFRSLKKIEVRDCSLLKKLPLDSHGANANELLVIEGEEDWWNNIEWEDDDTRVSFLPCFKPTV